MTTASAASPAAPIAVPTVAQSITVDWGSWISQALAHETAIIETTAEAGVNLALAQIPFGSFVAGFIGPTVVKQYVDQGLAALEGIIASDKLTIPASSVLMTTVANMINANEKALASFLGDKLDPMIKAAIGKLGL